MDKQQVEIKYTAYTFPWSSKERYSMRKRKPLSRSTILDAAMPLTKTLDVADFSIRKLAAELGVSPMAIYRHYENKDALLEDMLNAFIDAAMVVPEQQSDWKLWLQEFAQGMQRALLKQPGWLAYITRMPLGQSAVNVMQAFCCCLRNAGFAQPQAEQAFFSCLQLVLGSVCLAPPDAENTQNAELALQNSLGILLDGLQQQLKAAS